MVIGGAFSLSDRRLRVGAPKPASGKPATAAGGVTRCVGALSDSLSCAAALRRARRSRSSPTKSCQDPALEARARALSQELRCMVCQNQSIDDSDAPLAKDLRVLVRERLRRATATTR